MKRLLAGIRHLRAGRGVPPYTKRIENDLFSGRDREGQGGAGVRPRAQPARLTRTGCYPSSTARRGVSGGIVRPAAESVIKRSRRRWRVSSFFALTTK